MNSRERVYAAINQVGLSRRKDRQGNPINPDDWRRAALERFDETKKWKYIKRDYLEDDELYALNPGQEKRDFEGRLLQKIIIDSGLGKHGAQKLRSIMQRIRKSTNK